MTEPDVSGSRWAMWARRASVLRRGLPARSPRADRALLVVAAVVFAVATYAAWRSLPEGGVDLRWAPLLVAAVVGVPALLLLNSAEYKLAVESVGGRLTNVQSLRTNVLASAANLLPIPGSILVRIRGARGAGASLSAATAATALVGVAWMALTGLLAGGLQISVGRIPLGAILIAAGLALTGAVVALAQMHPEVNLDRPRQRRLLVIELSRIGVLAARFHLLLLAIGDSPSVDQSVALTISVVAATAIAIVPGGLGVRELSAAGIGPLVGLPASMALLAVAIDRLISLAVLGASAGIVAAQGDNVVVEPSPDSPPL